MAIGANAKVREAGYGWNLVTSTAQNLVLYCERLIFNLGNGGNCHSRLLSVTDDSSMNIIVAAVRITGSYRPSEA